MSFTNYLEDENDKPYFTTNSLAYYYDKMEGFAKAVEGSAKALNLTKEEIEQRISLRLAEWDKNLEGFDSSVEKLLTEWVDDGTLTHVIDSALIDQKIEPVTAQLTDISYNVKSEFNAKGDYNPVSNTGHDDTSALQLAFSSNVDLYLPGNYKITKPLDKVVTKNIKIYGNGGTIYYVSDTHIETAIKLTGSGVKIELESINIDGGKKCNKGLEILNNTVNKSSVSLKNISVKNIKRVNTFQGGDGIHIRGGYTDVLMDGVKVSNCELPMGQGDFGNVGITGVTVRHYSDLIYPEKITFNNSRIEKVYSSDPNYKNDQDGLRVANPVNVESFLFINNCDFEDCYGRFIKSQVKSNNIKGGTYTNRNPLSSGYIDMQYGGGVLDGLFFINRNGSISTCIISSSENGVGKSSSFVRNCDVRLYENSKILHFYSSGVRDGNMGMCSIDNVVVKGTATNLANFRINGKDNNLNISNCYVEKLEDSGDILGGLVRVLAGGNISPFEANVNIENCIHGNSLNPMPLVIDRVASVLATAIVSSVNNLGFLKIRDVFRLSKVSSGRGAYGYHEIVSGSVPANGEVTLDISNYYGVHVNALIDSPNGSYAQFNSSRSRTTKHISSADVFIGNNAEPIEGDIRIWFSERDKMKIKNTTAASKLFTVFIISNGS